MDSGIGNMAEAFQSAATQVAVNYFYSPYLFNKIICKNMGWSGEKKVMYSNVQDVSANSRLIRSLNIKVKDLIQRRKIKKKLC